MPACPEVFSVLAIDPLPERSERLCSELSRLGCFSVLSCCRSLDEGLNSIKHEEEFNFIFIADSLPEIGLLSFVTQVKRFYGCCRASLLLVQAQHPAVASADAVEWSNLIDGVVNEPFLVDQLERILSGQQELRKDRTHRQICTTIRLLIREIADQLDAIASLRSKGSAAALSRRIVAEMSGVLKDLPPEYQDYYWEQCVEYFSAGVVENEPAIPTLSQAACAQITAPVRMAELQQLIKELAA